MPPELHIFAGMLGFDLHFVVPTNIKMAVKQVHSKSLNLLELRGKKDIFCFCIKTIKDSWEDQSDLPELICI